MTSVKLQPLPLGNSDFEKIRSQGKVYVDKTGYIAQLMDEGDRFFLSRPRRFGKSLLISTFESLFKHGLKYFEGLAIESLWEDSKSYQVVHLDFSGIDPNAGGNDFHQRFIKHVYPFFRQFGFEFDFTGALNFYAELELWLKSQAASSLVLLIDEYDAPLTACLDKPELFEFVRTEMSQFYSLIKKCDGAFRFVFITGIAKFAKMSVFSAMNDLNDISLSPRYGQMLGYTQAEILKYFRPYLDHAAEVTDMEASAVLERMKLSYDGFCFDKLASTHVFSPWSTLKYLNEPDTEFDNFWFDSAGHPRMLLNYFKRHSFSDPEEYFAEKEIQLEALSLSSGAQDVDDRALMTQAGYLTIKRKKGRNLYVGYPNAEVRDSIARLYAQQILKPAGFNLVNNDEYRDCLGKLGGENIFMMFNRLIGNLSYNLFAASILEATVVSLYQLFMIGAGLKPHIETVSPKGRSDLQVTIDDRHLVLEFKVCRKGQAAQTVLQEAVKQIQEKGYGQGNSAKEVLRLALVFSASERRFVAWQEVPLSLF